MNAKHASGASIGGCCDIANRVSRHRKHGLGVQVLEALHSTVRITA